MLPRSLHALLRVLLNFPKRRAEYYFKTKEYRRWIDCYDTSSEKKNAALRKKLSHLTFATPPTISVILPICDPSLAVLQAAIASVQTQIWPHWELCMVDDASTNQQLLDYLIALQKKDPARFKLSFHQHRQGIAATTNEALTLASGEFVAFLDHDDLLAPNALAEIAIALHQHPEVGLIYTDEDKLDQRGRRCDPFFKPDWNPELMRSLNYCCHLSVLRRSLVNTLGGLDPNVDGAQDWDLLLRVTEQLASNQIIHIPKILYHWRISRHSTARSVKAKPHLTAASQQVLERHLKRIGRPFRAIHPIHRGGHWQVEYMLPEPAPLVSIIIPNRDQKKILQCCIESIQAKTEYPHYEILIADNDSHDPELLAYYRAQSANSKIRILPTPGPFNYSSINNRAVLEARGEILVLLNNDVEILHASWLQELVSHAIRPEVGAVGALLFYPHGPIQHAGVILGIAGPMRINGVAGHVGKYFPTQKTVGGNRMRVVQNFSAVTGACLAVRKKLYHEVGGMDETSLPVSFNDVDFCLKLYTAGYWNVWTPFVQLLHHESKSRKKENTFAKKMRFQKEIATMRARWGELLDHDPAYNPNLTLLHENWGLAWPPRLQRVKSNE